MMHQDEKAVNDSIRVVNYHLMHDIFFCPIFHWLGFMNLKFLFLMNIYTCLSMIQILYFRIEYVYNDHVIDIKIINIYSVTICSTNIIRYIRLFFFK